MMKRRLLINDPKLLSEVTRIASETALSHPFIKTDKNLAANQLEAVALLLSHLEQRSYQIFLSRLTEVTDPIFSKDLDFYIFMNRPGFIPDIEPLKKLFRNVFVNNLSLSPEEDVYIRPGERLPDNLPPLGSKSGPNTMFLSAISLLKEKNTTLFLETDVYFGAHWIQKLKSQPSSLNSFWISGATYGGPTQVPKLPGLLTHLNGVALYATGDAFFQEFIERLRSFIIRFSPVFPEIAYDHGIRLFIDGNLNSDQPNPIWTFIDQQLVRNKFILNFSMPSDSTVDAETLFNQHDYAILHKKTPASNL